MALTVICVNLVVGNGFSMPECVCLHSWTTHFGTHFGTLNENCYQNARHSGIMMTEMRDGECFSTSVELKINENTHLD
jgi:hypothetical protein